MTIAHDQPVSVAVVMLGPCSLLSVASVVDTLNEVNRQAKSVLYSLTLYRPTWSVPMQHTSAWLGGLIRFADVPECDWLWVLADETTPPDDLQPVLDRLRACASRARLVAGVRDGVWWLAKAGLLDGSAVSVHTGLYDSFAQNFGAVQGNQRIFDIDGGRISSSGGLATIDLLLALITQRHGAALAERVATALNAPPLRSRQTLQPATALTLAARREPRLMEALHLMETNLAEPLSTEEVARLVGVSRRHLERLFRQHMGVLPLGYYLELRLVHAELLLTQTSRPLNDIARSTGFNSAQYFSFAYRRKFGQRPRDVRNGRTTTSGCSPKSAAAISRLA